MGSDGVEWAQAVSGKWHGFRPGEARSACTLVARGGAEAADDSASARRCYWCRRALGLGSRQARHQPPPRRTEALAEFIGGPRDGTRLTLLVVEDGPERFRVIGQAYRRRVVTADEESSQTY